MGAQAITSKDTVTYPPSPETVYTLVAAPSPLDDYVACLPHAHAQCPHVTYINVNENNTDMGRWGSDYEYAKHVLDEQRTWEHLKCICEHCGSQLKTVWPIGNDMCHDAIVKTFDGGCKGNECCSAGTVLENGKCVATYDGVLQACKRARGDWGWTCHDN